MQGLNRYYIDGEWVIPQSRETAALISPVTEEPIATLVVGNRDDIGNAVAAAGRAFGHWSVETPGQRLALLRRLLEVYESRIEEIALAISREMGAPISLSRDVQAASGAAHIRSFIEELERFEFSGPLRSDTPDEWLFHEPVGVCGLITPWNWPMNQVCLKVPAAMSVGCTVVLKPSELAPLSSHLFAEIIDEAGYPPGVFNLVDGDGSTGALLSQSDGVGMVSLTGSCRAGAAVRHAAADSFKRVALELGGKSPNLIFADVDVDAAVSRGVASCFRNSGQSCDAPSRMLVERPVYEEAISIAARIANATRVGDPAEPGPHLGPVVSGHQFARIQEFINSGITEGARLVAGGPERPEGWERGYFVRPTIFADVKPNMQVAREEIFGPVLCLIPFDTEEDAVNMANDTKYGLSAYVQTNDGEKARRVARQIRSGVVRINGASRASGSPFGGFKHSGIGREGGKHGLQEFLELKAVAGWPGVPA